MLRGSGSLAADNESGGPYVLATVVAAHLLLSTRPDYCTSLTLDDMPGLAAARPTSAGITDRPTSFDLMALGNSAALRARGADWRPSTIARTCPAASSAT